MEINWAWQKFEALSGLEVYEILAIRQQVFAVEQQCAYLDADGIDIQSWHLCGRNSTQMLVAYARLMPPGVKYPELSIGRVLVLSAERGSGLGHQLVAQCLNKCRAEYYKQDIRISAQAHLEKFYASAGFERTGEPYNEDGIKHIAMRLTPQK